MMMYFLLSALVAFALIYGICENISCEELDERNNVTDISTDFELDPEKQELVVHVSLYLQEVDKIECSDEEFFFKFMYFAVWKNEKLSSNSANNATRVVPRTWFPKLLIANDDTRRGHQVAPDNQVLTNRNGTETYQERIFTNVQCLTDFTFYPFDVIECNIGLSLGQNAAMFNRSTILKWTKKVEPLRFSGDFVQPPLFSLHKHYVTRQPTPRTLSMNLYITRKHHYYLWKFYVPVLLVLLFSWAPFWLKRVLILRIYIGISTVIFLGWYYITRPNELHLPYLTALDAWRSVNFVFVMLAALESTLVAYMIKTNSPKVKRTHPDENAKFKMLTCDNCPLKKKYLEVTDEKKDLDLEILKLKANFKVRFVNVAKEVEIIDSVAKLFFPAAYSIFLFFYCFKCISNVASMPNYSDFII